MAAGATSGSATMRNDCHGEQRVHSIFRRQLEDQFHDLAPIRRSPREHVAPINVEEAFGHRAAGIANLAQHSLRDRIPLLGGHREEVGGGRVVPPNASPVGVHPAKAVLGLDVAEASDQLVLRCEGQRPSDSWRFRPLPVR